jgi:protein-disulfide isomerase
MAAGAKLTTNRILLIVLVVAAALAAVLIAVSLRGGKSSSTPVGVSGAGETQKLLAGIPQHGSVLGSPNAPVTIKEYADFQCPYCANWALDTFPALVKEYVRPGKAKIEFDGVAFIGPDSLTALQTAFAAGLQNKQWNVIDLLYRNQGTENAGWVTEDLLKAIGDAVPGLDTRKMLDDRSSTDVATAIGDAQGAAQEAGVATGPTPTFDIGRTGGPATQIQGALPTQEFRDKLDSLLGK